MVKSGMINTQHPMIGRQISLGVSRWCTCGHSRRISRQAEESGRNPQKNYLSNFRLLVVIALVYIWDIKLTHHAHHRLHDH